MSTEDGNEKDDLGNSTAAMFDNLEIENPDDVNEDVIEETNDQQHENEEKEDYDENKDIIQVEGEFNSFLIARAFELGKDQLKSYIVSEMREKRKTELFTHQSFISLCLRIVI